MKGDFTRNTFDRIRHFSRVLMQQGRVQLDADFNEQTAILLHYLRTLASDLVGPYWGPADSNERGFAIGDLTAQNNGDFTIGTGRYYVDGILCENDDAKLTYRTQAGFKDAPLPSKDKAYYVYLDVWERHITPIQDDRIREVALGGPDTCTRAQVIWQVRWAEYDKSTSPKCKDARDWVDTLRKLPKPMMRARVLLEYEDNNACSIPPESRYRGPENQLYRIEVHRGGVAWNGQTNSKDGTPAGNHECAATFKWSRDNGSVVFPIVRQQGEIVTLQTLGQDQRTRLQIDDWVEIIDDDLELRGEPGILAQVNKIDPVELIVTLKLPDDLAAVSCPPSSPYDQPQTDRVSWQSYDENSRNHPLLRRWDQRAAEGLAMSRGAILISEHALPEDGWIKIEDGIEVQFQSLMDQRVYHTGDYWLIPARVETGKIEWPLKLDDKGAVVRDAQGNEESDTRPPHGIKHHYAPLAVIKKNWDKTGCQCSVKTILECPP